jgi:ABC-2 type transport system permease protein
MTVVIIGFQKVFWVAGDKPIARAAAFGPGNPNPNEFPHLMTRMGVIFIVGLVLLWGAQRLFTRLQGNFAQEI